MAYKFRKSEVEEMKKSIEAHCAFDSSAWRLRAVMEGLAYCVRQGTREQARRLRELALYESLTFNDMPTWK